MKVFGDVWGWERAKLCMGSTLTQTAPGSFWQMPSGAGFVHAWVSVCFGSPLMASFTDPVWEDCAFSPQSPSPYGWRIYSASRQRGSRLDPASQLLPHLPLLLGRGEAHPSPSPGVKVSFPMPGHLSLLAFCWAKLSLMRSGFAGTMQRDVGPSAFGGCVTAWHQTCHSQQ